MTRKFRKKLKKANGEPRKPVPKLPDGGTCEYFEAKDGQLESVYCDEDGNKSPKEWIQIFPEGEIIVARDGRIIINSNPEKVVRTFKKEGIQLHIDLDHAQRTGLAGSAAGWIYDLEIRGNSSIWGRVKWTDHGLAKLASNEYKYCSPFFYSNYAQVEVEDGIFRDALTVEKLMNVGLVGVPAFVMETVASAREESDLQDEDDDKDDESEEKDLEKNEIQADEGKKGNKMNEEMLKLLGLGKEATETQVAEAIKGLLTKKVETKAPAQTAASIDVTKFVPIDDYKLQRTKIEELEKELKEFKEAKEKAENEAYASSVTSYLSEIQDSRLIDATSAKVYEMFCMADRGNLGKLKELIKVPDEKPVVKNLDLAGKVPGYANATPLGADLKKRYGLTEEEIERIERKNL